MFQVEEIEGRTTAIQNGCPFYEVSVAENSSDLYQAFEFLVTECRALQSSTKTRKFSVSKMLGTLIGNNSNGKTTNGGTQQHGGTVVVCHKSDLHRSRVLKRRQNFTATASLWLPAGGRTDHCSTPVPWTGTPREIFALSNCFVMNCRACRIDESITVMCSKVFCSCGLEKILFSTMLRLHSYEQVWVIAVICKFIKIFLVTKPKMSSHFYIQQCICCATLQFVNLKLYVEMQLDCSPGTVEKLFFSN